MVVDGRGVMERGCLAVGCRPALGVGGSQEDSWKKGGAHAYFRSHLLNCEDIRPLLWLHRRRPGKQTLEMGFDGLCDDGTSMSISDEATQPELVFLSLLGGL